MPTPKETQSLRSYEAEYARPSRFVQKISEWSPLKHSRSGTGYIPKTGFTMTDQSILSVTFGSFLVSIVLGSCLA